MKKSLICFFLFFNAFVFGQNNIQNPYGLAVVSKFEAYKESVKTQPDNELVNIKKAIPTVVLDIRYATKNNFMQQVMYKQAKAFARKPVVAQLKIIQEVLKSKGLGLKIFDAYRPYAVTIAFYQKAKDKNFVAHPAKGSRHNRGCAIDLTLVDLKTGKELPMPTPYDSFEEAASPSFAKHALMKFTQERFIQHVALSSAHPFHRGGNIDLFGFIQLTA
jgi:D-alanyl-D-alanine dipeptidase